MALNEEFGEGIVKRLNILITLLLEQLPAQSSFTMADKIRRLADLGVSSAEIARILGKPLNYVTASLSQRKSKKKKVTPNE